MTRRLVTALACTALLTSCTTAVNGNPTAAPQSAAPTPTSTTAAPPPGAELQKLALPVEDLRRIMNDPTLVKTATWFPDKITTDAELVAALRQGNYRALNRKKQTR